jgi:hypothetical protein
MLCKVLFCDPVVTFETEYTARTTQRVSRTTQRVVLHSSEYTVKEYSYDCITIRTVLIYLYWFKT